MMRQVAVAVARAPLIRKAAMSTPMVRDLAWRFVAGEDLAAGIAVARELAQQGLRTTLNHVGTHVRTQKEAIAAADAAVEALHRIHSECIDAHFSLKLTQIGLDVDEDLCRAQLGRVAEAARQTSVFVRIDMEEAAYTEQTLLLFEEARATTGDHVGIVLQSYLHRNEADLERMLVAGTRIRLVKGGYWETGKGAYRKRAEIDRAFVRDLERLLVRGRHPAIATHDERAIERAKQVAAAEGLAPGTYEVQMLYGVREDLQAELVREGHAVRCYVPYGTRWWEYVLGCLRRSPFRRSLRRARVGGEPP